MSKYKNTKIYCITNDIDNYKYIGSTSCHLRGSRVEEIQEVAGRWRQSRMITSCVHHVLTGSTIQ